MSNMKKLVSSLLLSTMLLPNLNVCSMDPLGGKDNNTRHCEGLDQPDPNRLKIKEEIKQGLWKCACKFLNKFGLTPEEIKNPKSIGKKKENELMFLLFTIKGNDDLHDKVRNELQSYKISTGDDLATLIDKMHVIEIRNPGGIKQKTQLIGCKTALMLWLINAVLNEKFNMGSLCISLPSKNMWFFNYERMILKQKLQDLRNYYCPSWLTNDIGVEENMHAAYARLVNALTKVAMKNQDYRFTIKCYGTPKNTQQEDPKRLTVMNEIKNGLLNCAGTFLTKSGFTPEELENPDTIDEKTKDRISLLISSNAPDKETHEKVLSELESCKISTGQDLAELIEKSHVINIESKGIKKRTKLGGSGTAVILWLINKLFSKKLKMGSLCINPMQRTVTFYNYSYIDMYKSIGQLNSLYLPSWLRAETVDEAYQNLVNVLTSEAIKSHDYPFKAMSYKSYLPGYIQA